MSGDYSRDSFDALRDFAAVFLQQGRAVLDSDWNELVEVFERRIRTATVDTIGRAVVPRETEHGFEILPNSGGFGIGRGRFYQYGKLLECHGAADFAADDETLGAPVFDRARDGSDGPEGVLDEMIAPPEGDFVDYLAQPYWPTPDTLPSDGAYLAYLVGWQREVTPTEMPDLLEPALGGLDTTTRWQTVWQVRALGGIGPNANCATPDQELPGWLAVSAPSTARLSSATIDIDDPETPCLIPPTEGYSGLENQFYRVEIHVVGEPDDNGNPPSQEAARFKFSRENASVRAPVAAIADDGESLTVSRVGRDEVLRFEPGNWVELTDNHREFNQRSGQMLRVADVDPDTREIEFEGTIDPDLIPSGVDDDTLANRRTRLIRWDQWGVIRLEDGTEWADMNADSSDGLIGVPPAGQAVVLESGITVTFDTAEGPGGYRAMDYWRFAARTAGTQLENLHQDPPHGIQRHYSRLGIVTPAPAGGAGVGSVINFREFWPPLVQAGEGCACTVCVTADGHNNGDLTLHDAVAAVGQNGGTICLDAGGYLLSQPLVLSGRAAIRIVGQGLGTLLYYQGSGGAVRVEGCTDVQLEHFSLLVNPEEDATGNILPSHGIAAINTAMLAIRRVAVLLFSPHPEDSFDFAIALDGVQLASKIEECVLLGPHAIGSRSSYGRDDDGDLQFAAFAELRVLDSVLFAGRDAVRFDRAAINIAAARLARNLVLSTGNGMRINWAEIPAASLSIDDSTLVAARSTLLLSAGTLRVRDCELSGGNQGGDGIALLANILPESANDTQLIGNTILNFSGAGIRIYGAQDTVFIKRNIIRDCGAAGIATAPDATIRHIAIDNNAIERIGLNATLDFAAAIGLTSVESGQVVGNSVRRVGEAGFSGQRYAGIAVQGVGSVDISSNVLSEIGGAQAESSAVGIQADAPILGLLINNNRVVGDFETSDQQVDWRAIRVGPLINDSALDGGILGNPASGFVANVPVFDTGDLIYFNADGAVWASSADSFAFLLPVTAAQLGVGGNQARTTQRLAGAMVSIVDTGGLGLSFANNHCELRSGGSLREVVILAAARVAAGSNIVTHSSDSLSLRILTGANGTATPIGNITSGGVDVHPAGLKPPFDALNPTA